jgi:cytochrome c-type biogenesis protein
MTGDVSILLAFTAGLFSFLSPCILPLIPSWLCLLGGVSLGDSPSALQDAPKGGQEAEASRPRPHEVFRSEKCFRPETGSRRRLISGTLSFILGFSAVFVILSILFSGTFFLLGGLGRIINVAAGIIVIILGLNICGNFLKFLNYERRFRHSGVRGLGGAFLAGAAFGAGWTPCVGPILGSILLLAGQGGKIGSAVLCLAAYSAGLGLPFLGAALALDRFLKGAAALRPYLPRIRWISGLFLIGIGLLILFGRFQSLNNFLMQGEYAFAAWVHGGSSRVRLVPALVFFLIALLIPACRILRGKSPLSRGAVIGFSFFCILGILQTAGFLDAAGLLARWFLFAKSGLIPRSSVPAQIIQLIKDLVLNQMV